MKTVRSFLIPLCACLILPLAIAAGQNRVPPTAGQQHLYSNNASAAQTGKDLAKTMSVLSEEGEHWQSIEIPMRDGKLLAADLYSLNRDMATAKPVILIQTPYNKNFYRESVDIPQEAGGARFPYDSINYNYVIVDWRGRFASRDAASPDADRGEDGYDCVEWIADQPWCDGRVGTWGPSALGQAQFETARFKPPHLVCAVPLVRDYKTEYHDYYYGGVFRQEHTQALSVLGFGTSNLILEHPTYDGTWRFVERQSDYADSIAVPMLLIGGWYDHFPDGVIRAFHDLRAQSAPEVRSQHRFLYGPWTHSGIGQAQQGILSYPNAEGEANAAALRFFDYYLRDMDNGWENEAVIRYYQLGENEWRAADNWYALAQATDTLFLHAGGELAQRPPEDDQSYDSLFYDPRDPSPSVGASRFTPFNPFTPLGPQDQAPVEQRADAIVFSTAVLGQDLEINGAISINLFVSSDRTDTDVSIRLCDVHPDGRSIILTDAIHRMRFRNSFETEELMAPGQVYPVTIGLQELAVTFKKGHRMRIIVSSSNYPRFHTNLNNGGPMYEAGDTLIALNRFYHNARFPSALILPVPATTSADFETPGNDASLHLSSRPNPASGRSILAFTLQNPGHISLDLFDMAGKRLKHLFSGYRSAGNHKVDVSLGDLAAGTYLCCLKSDSEQVCSTIRVQR